MLSDGTYHHVSQCQLCQMEHITKCHDVDGVIWNISPSVMMSMLSDGRHQQVPRCQWRPAPGLPVVVLLAQVFDVLQYQHVCLPSSGRHVLVLIQPHFVILVTRVLTNSRRTHLSLFSFGFAHIHSYYISTIP